MKNKCHLQSSLFEKFLLEDEIKLKGLVDHSMAASNQWTAAVERSLYINDLLYTKSPYLLRINSLKDLSSVKNISLEGKKGLIPVY